MVTVKVNWTGRRAKVGNLAFDPYGKPMVFVGYCDCHRKVMMNLREAEALAARWGRTKSSPKNHFLLKQIEKQQL